MTFEEWYERQGFWRDDNKTVIEIVWNAAQQAEREKYQELIAAAEAVIGSLVDPLLGERIDVSALRLKKVLERLKDEN